MGAGASKPSTETLKTLAALYDVPLEYLLNEDDPGPAHVERRIGKNTEVGHHKKPKWFALMLIGIGIMAVALWAVFFLSRGDEPNQMNHMKRDEQNSWKEQPTNKANGNRKSLGHLKGDVYKRQAVAKPVVEMMEATWKKA